jgi:hypothetical protein
MSEHFNHILSEEKINEIIKQWCFDKKISDNDFKITAQFFCNTQSIYFIFDFKKIKCRFVGSFEINVSEILHKKCIITSGVLLDPQVHKTGFARLFQNFKEAIAKENNIKYLIATTNKYQEHNAGILQHFGYKIISEFKNSRTTNDVKVLLKTL